MGHVVLQSLFVFLELLDLLHEQLYLFTWFSILVELVLKGFQCGIDCLVLSQVYLVVSHAASVTWASHFLADIYVWFCQSIHEIDIISIVFKYLKMFLIRADGLKRDGRLRFVLGNWFRWLLEIRFWSLSRFFGECYFFPIEHT